MYVWLILILLVIAVASHDRFVIYLEQQREEEYRSSRPKRAVVLGPPYLHRLM